MNSGEDYVYETDKYNPKSVFLKSWFNGIDNDPLNIIIWETGDQGFWYTVRKDDIIYRSENDGSNEMPFKKSIKQIHGWFTLFQNAFHEGISHEVHCSDYYCHNLDCSDYYCHNLDGGFKKKASSVNTHGGCVALFDDANCEGRRVVFKPNCKTGACCQHHSTFETCNFDNQATSYACC